MLDRVNSMQIFTQAAAAESFSAAARELGLTQTMVTKHIVALEQRFGARLFDRTSRRLSLTEAGRIFLAACPRILRDIAEAEGATAAGRVMARGRLRMTVPVSFGTLHVAPALWEFTKLHPHVEVALSLSDRVIDPVEEGCDLTLRIGRPPEGPPDSQTVARQISASRLVICASLAYVVRRGSPVTATDLAGHACLGATLSSFGGPDRWLFGPEGKTVVPISGPLRTNSAEALRNAALAGLGLIYQPLFLVADAMRRRELVQVASAIPALPDLGIYLLHPPAPAPVPKVAAMIDFLEARFRRPPPWEFELPGARS